jgi:4-hydroxy 2-oxovalerate aldolase
VGIAGQVGGQKDVIIEIALRIAKERDLGDLPVVGVR